MNKTPTINITYKTCLLVGILLLVSCGNSASRKTMKTANNGFDQLCDIYTQVFTEKKYAKLSLTQKGDVIDAKVHKTLTSVDAIEAYSSIWQVDPRKRYKIMKEAAEYSLKRPWQCDEMKKIFAGVAQKAEKNKIPQSKESKHRSRDK